MMQQPHPKSASPPITHPFPVGMVNFRDPAVIAQDSCAYTISTLLYRIRSTLNTPSDSGRPEVLAHRERPLHVSGPAAPCTQHASLFSRDARLPKFSPPAGSSSPLSNMNGASFKDVAPTGGRYGYVDIRASLWLPLPLAHRILELILLVLS
jgi:hypothetical protein